MIKEGMNMNFVCISPHFPHTYWQFCDRLKKNGINVRTTVDECEHYAVIDGKIVWHGGMNLLGKADVYDNLIKVRSD